MHPAYGVLKQVFKTSILLVLCGEGAYLVWGFENKAGRLDPSLLPRLMEAYNTDLSCSSAV